MGRDSGDWAVPSVARRWRAGRGAINHDERTDSIDVTGMNSGTEKLDTSDAGCDDSSRVAAVEQHRSLLFSIAYRMLGSVTDAEDVLQDAFIRWRQAVDVDIRSPRAYLVTIVSRLCINHLQSARAQRETYVGEWL